MEAAPVVPDFLHFLCSDRMRFERTWLMFLHVLVEAWEAPGTQRLREYATTIAPSEHSALAEALHAAHSDGTLKAINTIRHYMAHRDHRSYWDHGRTAVFGIFETARKLHDAFDILLKALARSVTDDPIMLCGEEYWYAFFKDPHGKKS